MDFSWKMISICYGLSDYFSEFSDGSVSNHSLGSQSCNIDAIYRRSFDSRCCPYLSSSYDISKILSTIIKKAHDYL